MSQDIFVIFSVIAVAAGVALAAAEPARSVLDFTMKSIDGQDTPLRQFQGKVLLLVNTASKCGFTPQFKALEEIYKRYKDQGLVILGFPANNFLGQEPGTDEQIKEFCLINYGVSFPMFGKIEVNGANAEPLFKYLKTTAPGAFGTEGIKWNFTKFLVGRDGEVVARYAPNDTPESMRADIEKQL